MEQPKQQGPDITNEVHALIGGQITQIISLQKERDGLLKMLAAFEKENKELKSKVKSKVK